MTVECEVIYTRVKNALTVHVAVNSNKFFELALKGMGWATPTSPTLVGNQQGATLGRRPRTTCARARDLWDLLRRAKD